MLLKIVKPHQRQKITGKQATAFHLPWECFYFHCHKLEELLKLTMSKGQTNLYDHPISSRQTLFHDLADQK